MGDLKDGTLTMGNWLNDWYDKNKAHFWTGVSLVGTVATAVSSAKDTQRIFRKHGDPKDLPIKERLKVYATNYLGTAGVAGISMYGALKSDKENGKVIAERTGLYLATRKSYDLLKKNLKEVVGEKKAQTVQDEAVKQDVQQHVTQQMVDAAPVYGRGDQVFRDGYTKLVFKSNIDYLRLCEKKLQDMMAELAPRGDEFDYYDKKIGVRYSEWLAFIGFPKDVYDSPERKDHGWNKGFAKDGSDDDPIEFYTTPVEYEEGKSCLEIVWSKDPTDMKLGRLMKSTGM